MYLILVDIFPFKNELKAIISHSLHEYENIRKLPTYNPQKVENYLLAFQLLFLGYSNKQVIWKSLEKLGKSHYIYSPEIQAMNYLETLPLVLYSYHGYGKHESKIVEMLGFQNFDFYEPRFIFDKVLVFVQNLHPIEHRLLILPWANNYDMFIYYLGIIDTRGVKISLLDYEILIGKPIAEFQKGSFFTTEDFDSNRKSSCLIPFFDFCNHQSGSDYLGRNFIKSNINFRNGAASINIHKSFKEGEEYSYSYITISQKQYFLFNYGFYDTSSIQSIYSHSFSLDKSEFTFHKYNICKKLSCINDLNIDYFYTDPKLQSVLVEFRLNQKKLSKRFIDLMKLLALPSTEVVNIPHIVSRIKNRQWINYKNEITGLIFLIKNLQEYGVEKSSPINNKLNTYDIIKIVMITRINCQKNKQKIDKSERLKYKLRVRNNIFSLALEFKRIYNKNFKLINKELLKIMADQFSKIKNYFMEDQDENMHNIFIK